VAGTLALQEIRPEDAIAEFERAVAQDSTFALAYLWLGQIYSGYNDFKRANECLDKAWRLRSRLGTKDQMRLEAARYDSNGPISEAVRVRREMYKRWPDDLQTLRDLQTQLFSRWYFGEAQEVATEARRYYPDDIQIFRYYSLSLLILGRVEEGLRATRSWVKQRPNEPAGWFTLSFMYVASAMPDSADAAYRKVVELDPGVASEDPGHPCALTYYRGDLKGATTCLEEFVGKTDFSESARQELTRAMRGVGLVGLYIEAGRYQKARDVCRDHMSPSTADLYQFRILNAMGQAREVRDLYEQWTNADSTNDYPYQLGIALAILGDVKGAREAARRLSGKEFDWGAMAHYCAFEVEAKAALADHDPKTALEFLGKMKQFGVIFGFYIDIDYRTMLAAAYKMDGRLQEAADVHKEMLRIYGGHALSHYELGAIYEEMKRPAEAKKEYAKFLEMWPEADEGLPQLVDAKKRFASL
jgi:tetratricopeptide (TPR) repeat protein